MSLNLRHIADDEGYDQDRPAGLGHNSSAPADESWETLLNPEGLKLWLDVEYETLKTKSEALLAAFDRWKADTEDGLKSDDTVKASTDFGKQIKELAKKIEDNRKIVKDPFFNADKAVHTWFRNMGEPLEKAVRAIEGKITAFNAEKAAAEKKRLQDEARVAREEADRLAALAIETGSSDLLEEAATKDAEVSKSEKAAAAPLADFSRVRGNFAMSSASTRYQFEVDDFTLIPREWLILDESKVNRAINGKDRVTAIPGLKITELHKTTIR